MSVTHPFVSAVVDDNTPTGGVGPDEWNASHTVVIGFLELDDVPATYVGQASKPVVVNVSENGLSFGTAVAPGAENFIELGDVPASYTGAAGKAVSVKADETGLEFSVSASSNGADFNPDEKPASPNTMDDEFDDDTGMSGTVNGLNARWAWRNQGTSTIVYNTPAGWLTLTPPSSATRNIRIIEQAQPSAQDYTIEAKIGMSSIGINYSQAGIVLVDGTNGDFYFFHFDVRTTVAFTVAVDVMTNVTTYSSTLVTFNWPHSFAYMKVVYVNSTDTYSFWISHDRVNWTRVRVDVDGIAVTKVGLGVDEETSSGLTRLHCDWFRRTA